MKNQPTQLDKVVKVSIVVGTLISALSIAYYLIIFLPQKENVRVEQQWIEKAEKEARELELKTAKCFTDAKRFHEDYIKTIGNYQYFEPKFGYNKKIDKCLYSGGYKNGSMWDRDWRREVKDIYTNETLLTASGSTAEFLEESNGAEKSNAYLENFWSEHAKLFNQ
jgi:hypothetical protein